MSARDPLDSSRYDRSANRAFPRAENFIAVAGQMRRDPQARRRRERLLSTFPDLTAFSGNENQAPEPWCDREERVTRDTLFMNGSFLM